MDDHYLTPDIAARELARKLIDTTRHAALGTLTPEGTPFVSRIACAPGADGVPLTLVSRLSQHTTALLSDPRGSLMLGDAGDLAQARLTLQVTASPRASTPELRALWLDAHPGAKVWIDFPDFVYLALTPSSGFLNAGFARAYRLTATDLAKT